MAFENLFIRVQRSLGGIQLDSVIQEAHDNTVQLTQNPIEKGADISDHAIVNPKKIRLNAVVTDSPLGSAGFTQIVDSVTGLFGASTPSNVTRSQQAYQQLIALMENREPIAITTRLLVYTDMVITSINVKQDKDTSRAIFLDIEAEQVIITESEVTELSAATLPEGTTQQQASPNTDLGRQSPGTVPPDENESNLIKIKNFFGGG